MLSGLAITVVGAACFLAGVLLGRMSAARPLREALTRLNVLKRDFETVTAVNARLLLRDGAPLSDAPDEDALERFMHMYDDAKRRLHRALDRHNATAQRPIVIARDGSNIVDVVDQVPRGGYSEDPDLDAALRLWLRHMFETDAQRRTARQSPAHGNVIALETERAAFEALQNDVIAQVRRRA